MISARPSMWSSWGWVATTSAHACPAPPGRGRTPAAPRSAMSARSFPVVPASTTIDRRGVGVVGVRRVPLLGQEQQLGVAVADVEQEVEQRRRVRADGGDQVRLATGRPVLLRHGPARPVDRGAAVAGGEDGAGPPPRSSPPPAGARPGPVPSAPGPAPRPARAAGRRPRRRRRPASRCCAPRPRGRRPARGARRRAAARNRGRPPRTPPAAPPPPSPSTAAKASPTRGVRRSHPS